MSGLPGLRYRTRGLLLSLLPVFLLILGGCDRGPATGPEEVRWDRETCERCRMVLSDRMHSAQVRGGDDRKVYKFDDIGGAILWLEDKAWKEDPTTELWVNDHRDGRWIDGYKARYVGGQVTPMEFGLGAQDSPLDGSMDYAAAREHVLAHQKKYNQPGMPLKEHMHEHH